MGLVGQILRAEVDYISSAQEQGRLLKQHLLTGNNLRDFVFRLILK